MDNRAITFTAAGDSLAISRICRTDPEMLKLKRELEQSDIVLTNLEGSVHEYENGIYPSQISGGDWVTIPPELIDDLNWMGFNLFSMPNNHSFDWMCNGILKTMENMKKRNCTFAGIGETMWDACRPAYYNTSGGRVGFIALTTSFESWQRAGFPRKDVGGRPGVFGISYQTVEYLSETELNLLVSISKKTGSPLKEHPDHSFSLGHTTFYNGTGKQRTMLFEEDKELLKQSIHLAARQSDVVIVSCHTHENRAGDPELNTDFQEELAHFCIDCGANAYIAHGPHTLRGIEIYKNAPVCYSLGNFFYQCELIERQPNEFYEKFKHFDGQATAADVFDYRIQQGGLLGETNPLYYQSVIARFILCAGRLTGLTLKPVSLNFGKHRAQKGTPYLCVGAQAATILTHIADLCRPYGTELTIHGDHADLII